MKMRLSRPIQCNIVSHRVLKKSGMETREKNMQSIRNRNIVLQMNEENGGIVT